MGFLFPGAQSSYHPKMDRRTLRLTTAPADLERAVEILRSGGLVAIPTETVYGLAGNALHADAVASIFKAKQRPQWDPLIVHISNLTMLRRVAAPLSSLATKLAEAFWPGPLTMLLPRVPELPPEVTAGRDLVGIRMPAHPIAHQLIAQARLPLAAPSANRFGHISPTQADHVLQDLDGLIDAVVDAGAATIGVESTVLDPNTDPITIYRHGGVSASEIERVTRKRTCFYTPPVQDSAPESLPSPGVGIRHYAPRARLLLATDQEDLDRLLRTLPRKETAVLLPRNWHTAADPQNTFLWGDWGNSSELARHLYGALRALDRPGIEFILCPLPPAPTTSSPNDLLLALRDRLHKAAMPA